MHKNVARFPVKLLIFAGLLGLNACNAFLQTSYSVTSSGDSVFDFKPSGVQRVRSQRTQVYLVTSRNPHISPSVEGTCPFGHWSGSNYVTGGISSNCTVAFRSHASPPTAQSQSLNVSYNRALSVTLAGTPSQGQSIVWGNTSIVISPAHGSLSGSAPNLLYTPASNYVGPDVFTFRVNDAILDSDLATIALVVSANYTVYLREEGNDSTAAVGDVAKSFRSAQAAVDAATAVSTAAHVAIIDVGSLTSGDFGDVTLTQDFGQYVSWTGADAAHSKIGNMTATGTRGSDGFNDQLGHSTNGQDGGAAHAILLNADSTVRFGNIVSNGGIAGDAFVGTDGGQPSPGASQNGGTITVGENTTVGQVMADGGAAQFDDGGNPGATGNGGTVIVRGTATTVSAVGGDYIYHFVSAGWADNDMSGGHGGFVTVYGTATSIEVDGSGGPNSGSGDNDGGNAGTINVYGSAGTLSAEGGEGRGGDGYSNGGSGGAVFVALGATAGSINTVGGLGGNSGGAAGAVTVNGMATAIVSTVGSTGGNNPTIYRGGIVNINGTVDSVTAKGASGSQGGIVTISGTVNSAVIVDGGSDDTGSFASAGQGGDIVLNSSAHTGDLSALGGDSHAYSPGGSGGTILLAMHAQCGGMYVTGGAGNYYDNGGGGGTITINRPASYGVPHILGGAGDAANGYAIGGTGSLILQ